MQTHQWDSEKGRRWAGSQGEEERVVETWGRKAEGNRAISAFEEGLYRNVPCRIGRGPPWD